MPRHLRGALRVTSPASLRQEVSHLWVPAAAQVFPTNMVLPPLGCRGSAVGQVTAQQVTVLIGVTRPLLLVPAFIFIFVGPSSGNKGFPWLTDSGFTFCWAGRERVMAGSQEDPVAGDKRHRFLPPGALHPDGEKRREDAALWGSTSLLEPSCAHWLGRASPPL